MFIKLYGSVKSIVNEVYIYHIYNDSLIQFK
jgi:hypothetical protein